jgi:hypothetical protein
MTKSSPEEDILLFGEHATKGGWISILLLAAEVE